MLCKKKGISKAKLSEKMGVDYSTVYRWGINKNSPKDEHLEELARIFEVSIAYLKGWTDNPESDETGIPSPSAEAELTATVHKPSQDLQSEATFLNTKFLKIPVIDPPRSIYAGNGFQYCGDDECGVVGVTYVDSSFITIYDDLRQPYAIHVDGNSMEGAGIPDGGMVVCNPAEEVSSGDSCVVCVGDDWFIKWVFFKRDGSVELKSVGNYPEITVSAEDAAVEGYFRVAGKIVAVVSKPKRGA